MTPSASGTIEQVMAYVDGDPSRAQEAYDLETSKPKPRATLVNALVQAGAKAPRVTPDEASTDASTEEAPVEAERDAENLLEQELGAEPIAMEGGTCETCQKPIDDNEIGLLSRTRFGKWQCTTCYIAQVSNK